MNDLTWTPEMIADACEKAAETLEGHWTKGSWHTRDNGEDAYCLEGGLAAAVGLKPSMMSAHGNRMALLECPVYQAVVDTLNARYGHGVKVYDTQTPDLTDFNDAHIRTEQEVLDVLHETAKRVLGVES